jgi:hypothetical protein
MIKRIFYRWEDWECYKAGFFEEHPPEGMTAEDCQNKYAEFLKDIHLFKTTAFEMIEQWKNSCEHNLTNCTMNRIAWIGQASVCFKYGIPAKFRGGFHLLTEQQKIRANRAALIVINHWMAANGYKLYTMNSIKSRTEANLY